jgi:Arm DNA-binding domain
VQIVAAEKVKFTERSVETLQISDERATFWDSELVGFGLRITSRAKVYFVKYRVCGVQRTYRIGVHGKPWTAAAARREASLLLQAVCRGIDPTEERATASAHT